MNTPNRRTRGWVRTTSLSLACLGLFAVTACAGTSANESDGGAGESVVLMAGHVLAESEPHHQIMLDVAEAVKDKTEGRVTIEVFPASQLGAEDEVFEQAHLGNEVIAWGGGDQVAEYAVPDFRVLLAPYLFENPLEDVQAFTQSDMYDGWVTEAADQANLRVLAMNWYFGDRHIISNEEYADPSQLENVKVRVPPSPVFTKSFEALGASPVTLDWAEVYTGLSQGVVDAAEAPLSTIYNSKLFEVADTVTMSGHINSTVGWTMSEEIFASLSKADQDVLLEEFRHGGELARDAFVEQEDDFREKLEDEGVTVVEADVPAYKQATEPFYEQFPDWSDDLAAQVRESVK